MRIKEIKQKEGSYWIYEVTFTPNWFEKWLGIKEQTKEYKDTGSNYVFGGGRVYVTKEGVELNNGNWIGKAIDRFRRSW